MPHEPSRTQERGSLADLSSTARRTRAEQLAAALETRVREQDLSPGDPVGTIESLRAETGFAYATVSEAVRLLRDRGVLDIRPGRGGGLFVADRGPVVRMRHTLLGVAEEPTVVADAVELRDHLEILVDLAAARCRTRKDVTALRSCLREMRSAPDWDGFVRANWALHERIAQIGPNAMARAVYVGTLGSLRATSTRFDDEHTATEYRAERYRIHADLVDAIADGDEDAVREVVARHNATQ